MKVSKLDIENLSVIRSNVTDFIKNCSERFDKEGVVILDIAPQKYLGAAEYFIRSTVKTLDIDKNAKADYIADICTNNSELIPDESFDYILCTEVLEHVLNPFEAIKEMYRMLKPQGYLLTSTPFNFRIHGPLPDCWRFTEHGLKSLLAEFKDVEIKAIESDDRFLMPIHYTTISRK